MRRVQISAVVFGLSAVVLVALALSVPASGGAGAPGGPDVSSLPEAATAPTLADSCQADSSEDTLTEAAAKPRFRACRCSCGAPCRTDADCGGAPGSCRTGITCC